jgi:hypothetical protein
MERRALGTIVQRGGQAASPQPYSVGGLQRKVEPHHANERSTLIQLERLVTCSRGTGISELQNGPALLAPSGSPSLASGLRTFRSG